MSIERGERREERKRREEVGPPRLEKEGRALTLKDALGEAENRWARLYAHPRSEEVLSGIQGTDRADAKEAEETTRYGGEGEGNGSTQREQTADGV